MKLFKLIFILITFCEAGTSYAFHCNPLEEKPLSATVIRYNFIAHARFNAVRIYSFSPDTYTNKTDFA